MSDRGGGPIVFLHRKEHAMDMNAGKSNLSTLLLAIFMLGITASVLIALMPPRF